MRLHNRSTDIIEYCRTWRLCKEDDANRNGNLEKGTPFFLLRLNYGLDCNKRSPFLKKFRKRRSFILIDLKERYVSEDECRQAIAEYNKDKQPDE